MSELPSTGDCATMALSSELERNSMLLTAVLLPTPEGGFTALNPETGSTSQGETVEEALANLREATELFLEEFPLSSSGRPLITALARH